MATINTQSHRGPRAKGPEELSDEVVADIVYGRGITSARRVLAKRFGISEGRVDDVWTEYYGGKTLKDAKGGLKKKPKCPPRDVPQVLPKNTIEQLPDGSRILKTTRGTYTLRPPTKQPAPAKGDTPTRVSNIADRVNGAPELDLEVTGTGADDQEISDNDAAKIVAGQVMAGNNNPELLAVLDRLVDINANMTKTTAMMVKQARARGRADARTQNKRGPTKSAPQYIEDDLGTSGYDDANEDSISAANTDFSDESSEGSEYEDDEDDGGFDHVDAGVGYEGAPGNWPNGGMDRRGVRPIQQSYEFAGRNNEILEGATGRQRRAEPVYSSIARRPVRDARQTNTGPVSGARQGLQLPKRDARKGLVQQNSSSNSGQLSEGPRESPTVNRAGAQRLNQDEWRAKLKRPP